MNTERRWLNIGNGHRADREGDEKSSHLRMTGVRENTVRV